MKLRPPIGWVSPVTRITLPACRAHYPGGSDGCARRLLLHPCSLPRFAGGSAFASLLSRPAQASLALRPVGSLNRPRRPLSRGFDPVGYPTKPLVSYQSYRQFPGWILPPLAIRALGAHCKNHDLLVFATIFSWNLASSCKLSQIRDKSVLVLSACNLIEATVPAIPGVHIIRIFK